jgi:tetratricopeptide (TPR) repeat protein
MRVISAYSKVEAWSRVEEGRYLMNSSKRRRSRVFALVALVVVVLVAAGTAIGLFFALGEKESAAELFDRGAEAFEQGRYDDAVDLYKEALEKEPESSVGYNLLGMGYRFLYLQTRNTGYREKEIEAFRKAIELDPRNYAALVNLGVTLYDQGDRTEAAQYLQKALEVYPQHPDRAQIEEMIRQAGQ